ncbi:MAG: DUF393 domain-containing protein [Verrucomicrobia bacterium]|nr:DUF393 domain-containing protein [Verrucomicrobiota bacterium]
MKTDTTIQGTERGLLFYDASCPLCAGMAARWENRLRARGFTLAPLQSADAVLLSLPPEELLREMRVLTPDNRVRGGADAVVFLARHFWWGWPLVLFAKLPGAMALLRFGYRKIAARRHCTTKAGCTNGGTR